MEVQLSCSEHANECLSFVDGMEFFWVVSSVFVNFSRMTASWS